MSVLPPVRAYAAQLRALFPRGRAWPEAGGPVWQSLMLSLAPELRRIDARTAALIDEADPRTTVEGLEDWERVLGLPDPCFGAVETVPERRALIGALLLIEGGQTPAYFEALCALFGHVITIEETAPSVTGLMRAGAELASSVQGFQCGVARSGEPVTSAAAPFYWRVRGTATARTSFAAGAGRASAPLGTYDNPTVRCLLDRFTPAHTRPVYHFEDPSP